MYDIIAHTILMQHVKEVGSVAAKAAVAEIDVESIFKVVFPGLDELVLADLVDMGEKMIENAFTSVYMHLPSEMEESAIEF